MPSLKTLVSELYYIHTNKSEFYNIMPIENISSVIQSGILSYEKCKNIKHSSVAMDIIQERRNIKKIPNGLYLHQYANTYFDARNPMMYKIKEKANILCILVISSEILNIEDSIITDKNASSDYVRFYVPIEGIDKLDYKNIFAQSWTDDDYYEYIKKKSIKCAEVLVPIKIDYSYIKSAIVVNENTKNLLKEKGFEKSIKIEPKLFFKG